MQIDHHGMRTYKKSCKISHKKLVILAEYNQKKHSAKLLTFHSTSVESKSVRGFNSEFGIFGGGGFGFSQRDLTMGCVFPIFRRYWLLSYSYFYGAQLIRFHIKFSTFVGN